jgi:hypothetical protein
MPIGGCWARLIDGLGVVIAWGWQRESTAFYASQGDVAFTQRVDILIEAIEVVPLAAFIDSEFKPLHILWITALSVAGEAWVVLDDPLGVLTWGHATVIPW